LGRLYRGGWIVALRLRDCPVQARYEFINYTLLEYLLARPGGRRAACYILHSTLDHRQPCRNPLALRPDLMTRIRRSAAVAVPLTRR
jgi:hypothetical protein